VNVKVKARKSPEFDLITERDMSKWKVQMNKEHTHTRARHSLTH